MGNKSPKHEQIVKWVKGKIERGEFKSGFKIPSENELSVLFGLSRQTVRKAISELEAGSLVESRRGSGTYISNLYPQPKSYAEKTMCVCVLTTYVDEYIFPPIIKEIETELSANGYTIQLAFTHNSHATERKVLENILERGGVDGLICETTRSGLPNPNLDLYRRLTDKNIPMVLLNSYYPELDIPHVSMDDKEAARMACRYLIDCGHKNIAAILKCDDGQGRRRYEGYVKALTEAGIPLNNDKVLWVDTMDLEMLHHQHKRIEDRLKECSACLCYNDSVAEKLINVCQRLGLKVPEDVSVVGIDNSEMSRYIIPPLTTVNNPLSKLGNTAALAILRQMNGDVMSASVELVPNMVVRESVTQI